MPSPMSSKGIERPIAVVNTEFAAVGSAQGPSKPLQTTTAGLQTISSATHRRRRGPWPPDPPPSPPRRRRSPAVAEETPAPKRHWRHADAPERARLQLASARPHLWADVEDYPTPLPVEGRHADRGQAKPADRQGAHRGRPHPCGRRRADVAEARRIRPPPWPPRLCMASTSRSGTPPIAAGTRDVVAATACVSLPLQRRRPPALDGRLGPPCGQCVRATASRRTGAAHG
jgi:hypothetical protein